MFLVVLKLPASSHQNTQIPKHQNSAKSWSYRISGMLRMKKDANEKHRGHLKQINDLLVVDGVVVEAEAAEVAEVAVEEEVVEAAGNVYG